MMAHRFAGFALAAMLLALPLIGAAQAKEAQQLSLSLQGSILDIQSHAYFHSASELVSAKILGYQLASGSAFSYQLSAFVKGFKAVGNAEIELSGRTQDGLKISLQADIVIGGMVPAEKFPVGCEDPDCTSAIAAFYLGKGLVKVRVDGQDNREVRTIPMAFALESAHLNPFGNPIVVLSVNEKGQPDGKVVIIAKYQKATIKWNGVKLGGSVSGTLGGGQVLGFFQMTVQAEEDLFKGTEKEVGTIALRDMSNPLLNVAGTFQGKSIIPTDQTKDCSSQLNLPSGTCTITGFMSSGQFVAVNSQVIVRGSYELTWMLPAVAFTGEAEASVFSK
jgi:hypothetical protein